MRKCKNIRDIFSRQWHNVLFLLSRRAYTIICVTRTTTRLSRRYTLSDQSAINLFESFFFADIVQMHLLFSIVSSRRQLVLGPVATPTPLNRALISRNFLISRYLWPLLIQRLPNRATVPIIILF